MQKLIYSKKLRIIDHWSPRK